MQNYLSSIPQNTPSKSLPLSQFLHLVLIFVVCGLKTQLAVVELLCYYTIRLTANPMTKCLVT